MLRMPLDLHSLLDEARDALPAAVRLRRRIHEQPELGLLLPETQRAVLEALEGLGLELETGGSTSAVLATLRGTQPGPTLLLRADMDALPMPEQSGVEYASRRDGAMHACGHDAHVAMLAAAARLLTRRRQALAGSLKLLFQPGEEGHGGARVLIGEGLLEAEPRVDAAFAIHVDPTLAPGRVATRPGPILAAADVFSVHVNGRGGHASMPHHAADPIPVACEIVLALQALVTRRFDAFDPVVLSVTRLEAGTTHNVIPPTASLLGTLRSVSESARSALHEGLKRVVEGVGAAHGLETKVDLIEGYPVTSNHAHFTRFAQQVARDLLGHGGAFELPAPIMGAEDFSYLLQRVPGSLVFLGVRPTQGEAHPLHSSRMRLDEAALAPGIALHAAVALRYLEAGGRVQGA
jgi:hippurate hydrolase